MKTRLDQLTLQNLIDLSCGDTKVLLEGDETPAEKVIISCIKQIMSEYKELATPTQAKIEMVEQESLTKLKMKEKCIRICLALISQLHMDMARDVLIELGVSEQFLTTDKDITIRCKAMLDEVMFEIKRVQEQEEESGKKKKLSPEELRKSWYSEIAFVMSVFKMSIDPMTINAAIYANLVRQSVERSKALAKMPPMAGLIM